jgi:hypothetical protein
VLGEWLSGHFPCSFFLSSRAGGKGEQPGVKPLPDARYALDRSCITLLNQPRAFRGSYVVVTDPLFQGSP